MKLIDKQKGAKTLTPIKAIDTIAPKEKIEVVRVRATKENGITLMVLVITVIVMLILAFVVLNLTIGDNGIIKKTEEGVKNYQNATNNETITLNNIDKEMDNLLNRVNGGNVEEPDDAMEKPTDEGSNVVDMTKKASYTFRVMVKEQPRQVGVKLYKIATYDPIQDKYTPITELEGVEGISTGLTTECIKDLKEEKPLINNSRLRSNIIEYIEQNNMSPLLTGTTDSKGEIVFSELEANACYVVIFDTIAMVEERENWKTSDFFLCPLIKGDDNKYHYDWRIKAIYKFSSLWLLE